MLIFFNQYSTYFITEKDCEKFIIKGAKNVSKLLESLRNPDFQPDEELYLEFKVIASYLLFFATSSPSPISSQFISQLSDVISKAGSAENIAFWCNWTPQQMSLMNSENLYHGSSFHSLTIKSK